MVFWKTKNKESEMEKIDGVPMSDLTIIDFGEILDISYAAKLHTQLREEVSTNSTVNFKTDNVSRIDASCLQVVASFMKYAKENDIKVIWDEPTDVLLEASKLLGLSKILELN